MRKLAFAFIIALIIPLINSCAGRNEDPQMEGGVRPDTVQSDITEDTGSTVVPEPRTNQDPGRVNYILQTDSARITRDGATVWLMVRGQLGNGCQRYEYFDSIALGSTLYLTFWASRSTDTTTVCDPKIQYFDKELRIENSPYKSFSVIQPDGRTRVLTLRDEPIL